MIIVEKKETYRFANIETIRRIQRAGGKYSDKELMLQFYLPTFIGGYTRSANKGRRTLGMCDILNLPPKLLLPSLVH